MKWIYLLWICLLISCDVPPGEKQRQPAESVASGERSLVCMVYHRFGDDRYPSTNISLANFKSHLEYLKDNNFMVMTLSQAVDYLKAEGEDKKVAVITVDDGYKSFKTGALPLLKAFDFPATLFVNTETVGSRSYLDWDELLTLKNEGIELGNHSHSHAYFLDLPQKQQAKVFREDVVKAQNMFKEHLNIVPQVFAYPYGEFSAEMMEVLKTLKFKAAAAQNSGAMHSGGNYHAIPRFPMSDAYAAGFVEKINMKPLVVAKEQPLSMMVKDEDPPALELTFKNDSLASDRLQCFIQGGECHIEIIRKRPLQIKVRSDIPLTRRRTLYTVTVPSLRGGWHWYSHLWVKPD